MATLLWALHSLLQVFSFLVEWREEDEKVEGDSCDLRVLEWSEGAKGGKKSL